MTDHGKSDVSKLVSVEEGYRLAAMHRSGMVIVMGSECAAERKVTPLSFTEMRKLPGPISWLEHDIGFEPSAWAWKYALFAEAVLERKLTRDEWLFLHDPATGIKEADEWHRRILACLTSRMENE